MKINHSTSLSSDSVLVQPPGSLPMDFHATSYNLEGDATAPSLDDVDIKPVSLFHLKSRKNKNILKKPLCVLIDTGARYSVIKPEYAHHGKIHRDGLMTFRTQSGTFTSNRTSELEFFLSEFSESRHIKWNFHVIPDTDNKMPYDMIIGRDLMKSLKMDVLYTENVIVWDELRLPMQEINTSLRSPGDFNALVEDHTESDAIKDQMARLNRILDANYDTPNLEEEVEKMTHLNKLQRTLLLALLKKHEPLFDGQLGDWKGDPVEIPLKEDAEPYHARAFPIAHVHEGTFKKDLDRLVSIGVLTKVNRSEWAAPAFIIPKKDNRFFKRIRLV